MRAGKLKVLFNSSPVEFKPESVVVEVNEQTQEIANDFVWVLAGGTPPNEFLKKIGVEFGAKDMTLEASSEVKQASLDQARTGRTMSARPE
jgi:thioredoxin reductase